MRVKLLLFALWVAASGVAATDPQKVYAGLMSDGDLYVGEGVVSLADYGGDLDKAKGSGRERARGNLVEGIRVKVTSVSTDSMSDTKQSFETKSSSVSQLELEGIQYKYLADYPKAGQLTVLASLSKEDFQRQNDRRVLPYRPNRGLRLYTGMRSTSKFDDDITLYDKAPASVTNPQSVESGGLNSELGADVFWQSWFVGAGLVMTNKKAYFVDASQPGGYDITSKGYLLLQARAGYEYTPWATRLQLVIPMQLEYSALKWNDFEAQGFGGAVGGIMRYWAVDRVALDLGFKWHQGFSTADVTRSGAAMYYRPGIKASFSPTGPEVCVGLLWNGF